MQRCWGHLVAARARQTCRRGSRTIPKFLQASQSSPCIFKPTQKFDYTEHVSFAHLIGPPVFEWFPVSSVAVQRLRREARDKTNQPDLIAPDQGITRPTCEWLSPLCCEEDQNSMENLELWIFLVCREKSIAVGAVVHVIVLSSFIFKLKSQQPISPEERREAVD